MGLFWDLIQQNQLAEQSSKAESLEQRVHQLEEELKNTRSLLQRTLEVLEVYVKQDIDNDGSIG